MSVGMRNYDKVRGEAVCPLCLHTQATLSCGNGMRDQTPMPASAINKLIGLIRTEPCRDAAHACTCERRAQLHRGC